MKVLLELSRLVRMALIGVCAVVAALSPDQAEAQGVAMVADVAGRVTGQGPVTITSEIAADARIQVDAGGRLVVIYHKSGDEYSFSGPAQIRFGAAEPQVVSGAQAQKRTSPIAGGAGVTIKPAGVVQATIVMRSSRPTARIKLLSLAGTKTLEAAPEFRWQEIEPGVRYRFELTDDTGRSLHEAEVQGTSFKLPDSVQLRAGTDYAWEVSARMPDGRRYVSRGEFGVATPDVRARAQALRPAADTAVSDRVAYAAWLDQAELKDEARKYWKALAAERPGDASLKALAAD